MKYPYLNLPDDFTWEDTKIISNGCGTGGWKNSLVPETIYGVRVTPACDIHDWEYWFYLDWNGKGIADKRFLRNLYLIIKHETTWRSKWLNPLRRHRARIYYRAVCLLGKQAFLEGKKGVNA